MKGRVTLGVLTLASSGCQGRCECDIWETDIFLQAPAVEPQLDTFHLTHFANRDTIDVSVFDSGGVEVPASEAPGDDWSYVESQASSAASLVFQPDAVPPPGSVIAADYVCSEGCDAPLSYAD